MAASFDVGAMLVSDVAPSRVVDEAGLLAADFSLDRHRTIFASFRRFAQKRPTTTSDVRYSNIGQSNRECCLEMRCQVPIRSNRVKPNCARRRQVWEPGSD